MFVIKLISHSYPSKNPDAPLEQLASYIPAPQTTSTHCISAPHYQVLEDNDGVFISVFDNIKDRNHYGLPRDTDDGIREVGFVGGKDFNECFIENSAGKTIARYSVFDVGTPGESAEVAQGQN